MRVRMLVDTRYDGEPLKKGQEIQASDTVAGRWNARGIAEIIADEDDAFPPMLLSVAALEALAPEQLKDYASAHGVDVGRATTDKGMIEKILEAGKVQAAPQEG